VRGAGEVMDGGGRAGMDIGDGGGEKKEA